MIPKKTYTLNLTNPIISNNLNMVMKFLASITIILAVPTIIFSLWGVNVPLPFSTSEMGFIYIIGIAFICAIGAIVMLWRKDLF
ncbi:CorA family divalent cation transporter [Megasphaera cerevisiae]